MIKFGRIKIKVKAIKLSQSKNINSTDLNVNYKPSVLENTMNIIKENDFEIDTDKRELDSNSKVRTLGPRFG